ncbi:uncharacterized protein LTHEOB_9556 [Lasiodiplodia theobromae]|uniref:uncharacterized protein n=1 Tax=Lasiodiplodia theobromae TaxID=45133 RepID=UPI0015C310C2|nr:uncharacterized protein LTHEOB_9556 [Lasiodiplodia theobromae]KAF4540082.1 hypothetical protein LTHEOB_9556 [Lasiodiplodia theobromae]
MAPSEAFSTAANVFSVVGLADIVFKYGREVYETLSKVRNAPEEIKQLLGEVKDVEGHASRVKAFLTDLAQSALQQQRRDLASRIETLLLHFQEELVIISKSVTESTLSSSDGWLKKLRKNAKWVWDEQDITLARRRLERWKRELDSTLILAGRKMDVSIHAEIASARVDITQGSSDSTAALSHIRNTASSIENKVDGLSTTVGTFLQDNNAQVSGLRGIVLDTQEATNSARMQVLQKLDSVTGGSKAQHSALQNDVRGGVNSVRKDIHIMSQSMRQSRRQQTRKQRSATKKIMNKLEEVNANMVDNFATLNLTRTGDGAFTFEGSNLEAMTLPLELLYSELVRTLPALQSKTKLNVSQSEAGWIQQQFEMVRAASFEISATSLAKDPQLQQAAGR